SALRQRSDDVESADGFQLEIEIVEQVDDELLCFAARALGHLAGLLGTELGLLGALHVEVTEDRATHGADREHAAYCGDLPRAYQRLPGRPFTLPLRCELAFGFVARFALVAQSAAGRHDA